MTLDVLQSRFKSEVPEGETIAVIGGEMGGGVMAAQCCAVAPLVFTRGLLNWCDFSYMRKERKKSGLMQQMEAPNHLTTRTPDSPPMRAVWLDEANSSGAELLKNVHLLKDDYNIEVIGAIYLVDRSRDRRTLELEKLQMANPALKNVKVYALYDLEQIDPLITR